MSLKETIYRYVNGEMTPDERINFEAQLKTDDQLKEQVAIENLIIQGIEHFGKKQLKGSVKGKVKQYHQNQKSRTYRWIGLAIGIVTTAIIGYLYFKAQDPLQKSVDKQIFAQYYTAPTLTSGTRAGETADLNDKIRNFYADHNYSAIVNTLSNVSPLTAELSLMLGISYMESEDNKKAIETFSDIHSSDVLYFDHAQWYSALCYLKIHQNSKAMEVFQAIASDTTHDHYDEAINILKKI